ncbi:MAG: hypothetical protein AAF502_09510 [Bacteroidota bacterium]
MRKHNYHIVLQVSTLIFALATVIQVQVNGTGEESIEWLIATTAYTSAILFSVAFGISSVYFFLRDKWSKLIFRLRPHIGLVFGVSHTFHLFFIIWLDSSIESVFSTVNTISLIGGIIAYGFIYVLMFTTFPRIKRKMNPLYWKALRLVGSYWIWAVFLIFYLREVKVTGDGLMMLILLIAVIVLRQVHVFFKRRREVR